MKRPENIPVLQEKKRVAALPDQFLMYEFNRDSLAELKLDYKPPHRHSHQEVIWIRHGTAVHLLDGESAEFSARSLIIIPKGRLHRFVPSSDCNGLAVMFREEFLSDPSYLLFSQFSGHTVLQPTRKESCAIDAYFSLLYREYRSSDPYQLNVLRHLLAALIAKVEELRLLHSRLNPRDVKRTLDIWNRFNALIGHKFKTEHFVGFYAAELGISTRKLGEVAKIYTGKHVSDVIDERLITEAKRLILFSNRSIKEIAFELGFEEHSYFSKVFKKITGKTPSDFKKITFPA